MSVSGFNSTPRLRKKPTPKLAQVTPPDKKPHDPLRAIYARVKRDVDRPGQADKDDYPQWFVWNKHTAYMPRYRHPTEESAKAEALRLSVKHPGRRFYLARVDGFVVSPTVAGEPQGEEARELGASQV